MQRFCLLLIFVLSSSLAEETAKVGSFKITFNKESVPSIRITKGESIVWFSSPSSSKGLVVAAKVNQTVSQNGGDYIIRETVIDKCNTSTLTTMLIKELSVVVQGTLCNRYNFSLAFESVKISDQYEHLHFNLTLHSNHFNQLQFLYGCSREEGFFGMGEQYTHINMRGHSVPLFISEQGVGRGAEPVTFLIDLLSPGGG